MQQVFKYNEVDITFNTGDNLMVNASEMAKAFSKLPADYLKTKATKEFIAAYIEENSVMTNPITVIQGGANQGTWMPEDIALDFAAWLSPKFKMWCIARIKELLKTGSTSLQTPDQIIKAGYIALMDKVELLEGTIKQQAPKVRAMDEIMGSNTLLTTTEVALNLQLSAKALNKKLAEKKVQHKVGTSWVLNARYLSEGYARLIPVPYLDSNGEQKTNNQLKWTEKGREFIRQTFTH